EEALGISFPKGTMVEESASSVPVPPMPHEQNLCRTLLPLGLEVTGFPGASEKFCTLALPSWRPKRSEALAGMCLVDVEVIFTIHVDMSVPRGPDMGQIALLHGRAFLLQLLHHGCHGDRIPDNDRIRHQIEAERLMG